MPLSSFPWHRVPPRARRARAEVSRVDLTNKLILLGSLLLLVSIVASALSARTGAPLLLVFLVLGMLAGEEGPGGIHFHDVQSAFLVGTLALAVILFDGGLRTRTESFRVGLWPAVSLATLGVILTAVVAGLTAAWVLDLSWLEGLLIGAIIGSTDAAAVFSLLHARGLELKERVRATLEIESGSNDPMAVFLTIALVELLAAGRTALGWDVLVYLAQQMVIGAVLGVLGGRALAWLINRLTLVSGLYPLLAMAGGLLTFGLAAVLGGSGFLAIYLAGLVLGNERLHAAQNILRVHDGLAWLSQIVMFLVLGLLVTPSALFAQAWPALLVALVLMLAARPIAVWLCLLPFRFPWREQAYIAWVGLRGAVPIILALFPLIAGLERAEVYFNVAFFVVLISLVVQGWTVAPAARWLKLEVPADTGPIQRVNLEVPDRYDYEFVGYQLAPQGVPPAEDIKRLRLPPDTRVVALIRADRVFNAGEMHDLRPGDYLYLLAPSRRIEMLNHLFSASPRPIHLEEHHFFGEFALNGDARLGDVAAVYGFAVPAEAADAAVGEFLAARLRHKPVVGDRHRLGNVELVVREIEGERITKVGLVLAPPKGVSP